MSCVWKKRLGEVTEGVRVVGGKGQPRGVEGFRWWSRRSLAGAAGNFPDKKSDLCATQRRRKLYPYAHFYWFIEYIELDSHSCSALVFGRMETDLR
jgi:hypothetical protein